MRHGLGFLIPALLLPTAVMGLVFGPITAASADRDSRSLDEARTISNVLEATLTPGHPDGSDPGNGGPGDNAGSGQRGGGIIGNPYDQDPASGSGQAQEIKADEGAVVTTADGRLTITVPGNAVPAGSTVYVRPLAAGQRPSLDDAGLVLMDDLIYEVLIVDAKGMPVRQLTRPLTLVFQPPAADAPTTPEDLWIFYRDEGLEAWIALPSRRSPDGRTVTAEVDHLTIFALAAAPDLTLPIDLTDHWAEADVYKLASLGAVTGYPDGMFRPDRLVSRAEFTSMLTRALRIPPVDEAPPFHDPIPAWASGYLAAAADRGLIGGYDDGTFRPDEPVTREEAAAMVLRALPSTRGAGAGGMLANPGTFADADDISAWASESVALATRYGLIAGFEDGTFRPQDPTTRAQAAAMMARLLRLTAK